MAHEWEHLLPLVDALVASGNAIENGGFRPTQGGYECGLRDPLDPDVVRNFLATDDRLTYDETADQVACRHCWAMVYGGRAAERYLAEHNRARGG